MLGAVSQIGLVLFMFLIGLQLDLQALRGKAQGVDRHQPLEHLRTVRPRRRFGNLPLPSRLVGRRVVHVVSLVHGRLHEHHRVPGAGAHPHRTTALGNQSGRHHHHVRGGRRRHGVVPTRLRGFHRQVDAFHGRAGHADAHVGVHRSHALLVRPFLARLGSGLSREGLTQQLVAVTLIALLTSSLITELIGIHALFGAFMLGAVMPKEGNFARLLAEKLEDLVVVFLLPMFFAYSGLRTRLGLLNSAAGLVHVRAHHFRGVRWQVRREASSPRGSPGSAGKSRRLVGILMNTRGLMELIVLNIGLDLGVISPTLFAMMVIMALVTTFMTTPLLGWVMPQSEVDRELETKSGAIALPKAHTGFGVLMCVAFDRAGPAMVTLAGALVSGQASQNRLYALRLIRPSDRTSFYLVEDKEQSQVPGLGPLLDRAEKLNLTVSPISFVSPRPAEDICNVAEVKGADLILLGWHKPVLTRTALGGTVADVLEKASADVAVFVDRGLTTVRRVLVPFQGTPDDKAALELARRATAVGAEITILHVIKPGREANERLGAQDEIEHTFTEEGPWTRASVRMKLVSHEKPAIAAIEESARGYDLVIVGAGHEWGLERRLFGMAPELMVEKCPTSLLLVRRYLRSSSAAGAAHPKIA